MPKLKIRDYKITSIADFARRYPHLVDHVPETFKPLYGKIDHIRSLGVDLEGLEANEAPQE